MLQLLTRAKKKKKCNVFCLAYFNNMSIAVIQISSKLVYESSKNIFVNREILCMTNV